MILREYESRELELTREQAEALQSTGFVDVTPARGDRWRVTATSFVGTLVVDDVKLLIRPKTNVENLFLLLEPGLPAQAWQREAFDYDSSSDLLTSTVAFFARTLETTLARGILRSYRVVDDVRVALRGRLDMAGQFRRAGVMTPVACTYDDFTEDVAENQVLRAATRQALRVPGIDPGDRQRLQRQLGALEGVSDIPGKAEIIDNIHLTRLNQHYAPALRLAQLILANLTLTDAAGTKTASSFMVDMNDLFQRFVCERLRRELLGRLEVLNEPPVYLGIGNRVTMLPDLVFRDPRRRRIHYVGDIKYKLTGSGKGRSSDYYQLLAYTTALDLPEGMLIYCQHTDAETDQSAVVVRNAGTRLVVQAIDLTGPPASVECEISALADAIASSSGA